MDDHDPKPDSWMELTSGMLVRLPVYLVIFILLYLLSQGPACYFHNRGIRGEGAGYPRFLRVVYAPVQGIQNGIPYYHDYLKWWLRPD